MNPSLRCDADIVLRNIFRALDTNNSGKISPRDLMLTFTMAMTGTSELTGLGRIWELLQFMFYIYIYIIIYEHYM